MTTQRRKKSTSSSTPEPETPASDMRIEYEPLASLLARRAPRNPKLHDQEGVAASMRRFGYTIPPAIDEGTNKLVAGHGRIEALEALKASGGAPPDRVKLDAKTGDWLVPVLRGIRFPNPDEAEAYLLADNRHTEVGGYDDAMLAEMLEQVRDRGEGLDGLGWSDDQATDMIASIRDAAGGAGDDPRERLPPDDFKDHDADSKKTVHCPKCGFSVVLE